MARPYPPDPEESGFLEPPRRRPPTAVGVATPPPPSRDPHDRVVRSRTRLISFGILAASLAAAGTGAFVLRGLLGYLIGTTSMLVSIGISIRIRRDFRSRRDAHERREHRRAA